MAGYETEGHSARGGVIARETTRHVNDGSSRAAQLFFSRANTEALQSGIRYRVHVESGGRHTIGRQSERELAVVMRSILLQYGRNNDAEDAVAQVRELNARVLRFCVPRIISEADAYAHYRRDVDASPALMDRGVASSTKGRGERSLEYGSAVFL